MAHRNPTFPFRVLVTHFFLTLGSSWKGHLHHRDLHTGLPCGARLREEQAQSGVVMSSHLGLQWLFPLEVAPFLIERAVLEEAPVRTEEGDSTFLVN